MARVRLIEAAGLITVVASLAACSGTSASGSQPTAVRPTSTAAPAANASATTPSPSQSETGSASTVVASTQTTATPATGLAAAESTQVLQNVRKLYSAALDDSTTRGGQSHFASGGLGIKDVTPVIADSAAVDAIWGPATSSSVRTLMCGSSLGTNGAVVGAPAVSGGVVRVPVQIMDATQAVATATVTVDPASGKITGVTCRTPVPQLPGAAAVEGYWGTLVSTDPNADKTKFFTAAYRAKWPSDTTYVGPTWECSQNSAPWWVATQDAAATTTVDYGVEISGRTATDTVDVALGQIAGVSCK